MKDYLKKYYTARFRQITPYFWDPTVTTDLKSHYIQLDVTDLKGYVFKSKVKWPGMGSLPISSN